MDLPESKRFFEHVFDWKFEKFPVPYDYYQIQAGDESETGWQAGIVSIISFVMMWVVR